MQDKYVWYVAQTISLYVECLQHDFLHKILSTLLAKVHIKCCNMKVVFVKNDSSFFEDSEAVSYRLGCFYTISQKLVGKNPEGWLHKKNSTTCGWTSLSKCQWQTRWQFKQQRRHERECFTQLVDMRNSKTRMVDVARIFCKIVKNLFPPTIKYPNCLFKEIQHSMKSES